MARKSGLEDVPENVISQHAVRSLTKFLTKGTTCFPLVLRRIDDVQKGGKKEFDTLFSFFAFFLFFFLRYRSLKFRSSQIDQNKLAEFR